MSSRLEGIQGSAPQKTAGGYTLFVSHGETSGDAGRHKAEETTDN